jgi:hypothetical protein
MDPLIVRLRTAALDRGACAFHLAEASGMSYGSAWRLLNSEELEAPSWKAVCALASVAGMRLVAEQNPEAQPLRARITRLGTTQPRSSRTHHMAKRKTKAKTKRKTTKRRKRRG